MHWIWSNIFLSLDYILSLQKWFLSTHHITCNIVVLVVSQDLTSWAHQRIFLWQKFCSLVNILEKKIGEMKNWKKERNHGVHMFMCDYIMTCIFLISWEWIEPTWKMVNYEYQLLTLIALFTKFLVEMILNIKDLDSGYFNFLKCLVQFIICIISLVQMI
jgi:hypothetical protein